ncbi:MAG: Na/Pi cotransporter family protein [Nitrospinota bacterium]|nr:MAG: Na/Pi cotransporter family protein [Nitrospinota bacterium]
MHFLELLIGLVFFMYGSRLACEGLQARAGDKMRGLVTSLTQNRFMALIAGIILTVILQSSSATAILMVGFANAGIISLTQAMGVMLGGGIGTTITVQVISFQISQYIRWAIVFGFLLLFFSKRPATRSLGQIFLGFGLLFFGMQTMAEAGRPLQQSILFQDILHSLEANPVLTIVFSVIFTSLVQSSAVTLGLILSLSFNGLLTLSTAIPIILGANVGNIAGAFLASWGTNVEGKRIAWAQLIYKITGVLLFLPFLDPFARLVEQTSADLPHQIANAHTLYNLAVSLAFLPFISLGAWVVRKIVPDEPELKGGGIQVLYLNERALDTPALAFAQATREILRMAEHVQQMFSDALLAFQTHDPALLDEMSSRDDIIDFLEHRIKLYLTKLSRGALTEEQAARELELISFTTELENVGDIIELNVVELARKKMEKRLEFSKEGFAEICDFHKKIEENFELAIAAFATGDPEIARKLLRHKRKLAEIARHLRESHIQRLHKGLRESIETSSIHLDLISNLRRINSHLCSIAYPILERNRLEIS